MISWPAFPYDLIGRGTVLVLAVILAIFILGAVILGGAFIWTRGWSYISNVMWRGYDPDDNDYPPAWKIRISGITIALARFQFHKIPAAYREGGEMTDKDITARAAMQRYLTNVFDLD